MIVVKLMGGTGNQMFQWALGRSLSLKLNVPLKLDLTFLLDRTPRENFTFRDYELDIFKLEADFAGPKDVARFISPSNSIAMKLGTKIKRALSGFQVIQEPHFHFNPDILNSSDNIYLDGYWQSPKYFAAIEEQIRKDFSFREPMPELSMQMADELKKQTSVCVHVRRGDFVTNPEVNSFHGTVGLKYIRMGLDKIAKSVSDFKVFIFSDDLPWCRENLKFDYPYQFVAEEYKGPRFAAYMELMSMCDHFVIPNSTFVWWAAWLARNPNKIVITPKTWFAGADFDTGDLIPEGWHRI